MVLMGHYMTKEERIRLETLLDEKKPVSYIAQKLGFSRQTIYNEITPAEIQRVQDWMNRYPRKVLNWQTPNQATA